MGIGVALLRCGDQAGVHDLTRHGNVAGRAHGLIEAVKQRLDRPGAGQPFAAQPDRLGVRNPLAERQSEKARERKPVIVRQVALRLDHPSLSQSSQIAPRPSTGESKSDQHRAGHV